MATVEKKQPKKVTLLQFKCHTPPTSKVVRKIKDETLLEAEARQDGNKLLPPPVQHFFKTGVIPKKLRTFLGGMQPVDFKHQKRWGIAPNGRVRQHILVTCELHEQPELPPTTAEAEEQWKLIQTYCDDRWCQVRLSTFPNRPELQSILFVSEAEHPKGEQPIDDKEAEEFGILVTRRGEMAG